MDNEAIVEYNRLLAEASQEKARAAQYQKDYAEASLFGDLKNQSSMEWRLDLSAELDRLVHVLQGERIVQDKQGNEEWARALDPTSRVLSDYGIDLISQTISFLINKNTMLSNFNTTEIDRKMLNFGQELAEKIYTSYEKIFYMPPVEDLIERDMRIVKELESKIKRFKDESGEVYNLLKKKYDEVASKKIDTLKNKTIEDYEAEAKSAFECAKTTYPFIHELLMQAVHATYNRAWKGGERQALHTSWHVSESVNPLGSKSNPVNTMPVSRPSLLKPWTWNRR